MAVGARGRDILAQFLVEALTLSAVGGVLGVVIGVLTAIIIGRWAEWSTDISVQSVAMAFAFAGVIGVFFGFYPAQKAARLDPIEALRYE
jgi:putative ABC transport system permease protein